MTPLRRWAALAVLLLPVLLISIDMSALGIAVPALSADLRPSATQLLWIIDLYSFLLSGLLILMGSLGDRFGRRRLLMIGAPLFGAASLLAAFSTTPQMLILARALLGVGGATLMPSTLGLIRAIFPDRTERRTAVAVWAMAFSGGAALGPVVGGLLIEHFPWGSVFLINVPVILLFLALAPVLLPESRDPHPGPFDVASALASIVGLLGVVYALKTLVRAPEPSAWAALVLGLASLAWFVRRQRRLPHPMIDLALFAHPTFSAAVAVNVLSVFTLMGVMFFFPQHLMLVRGMGSAEAGTWLLPLAVATILGTAAAPALARRMSERAVIMLGLAVVIAGFATAGRQHADGPLTAFLLASVLLGTGIGLAETLTNDLVLSVAPPERASAAAAISETGYELGGAMGTAVLGTVGMAVYSARMHAAAELPGVDQATADAAAQTLAAAHETAATIPHDGAALRALADASFTAGMDVVALASAAVAAAALVIAWRGFAAPSEHE